MTSTAPGSAEGFLAELGAAMVAATYPIRVVRDVLGRATRAYGLDSARFLVMPSFTLIDDLGVTSGNTTLARPEVELRYDQTYPLADLVSQAEAGAVTPEEGTRELRRLLSSGSWVPAWLSVVGYAVKAAGFALILQPTPVALVLAIGLGLLVGLARLAAHRNEALQPLLPAACAFGISLLVFVAAQHWNLGDNPLRALAPPLAAFLPGTAIAVSVMDLSSKEVIAGSSRLIAGVMQILQLTLGVLVAAQVTGVGPDDLFNDPANRLGAWAPWLGVGVYALGVWLHFGPPRRVLPWMVLMLYVAYVGQVIGGSLLGAYCSGFVGGAILIVSAYACSRYRNAPPPMSMLLPGIWLLVPGSMGLIGVTELVSRNTSAAAQDLAATLVSMLTIALGIQTGLLLCRASDRWMAGGVAPATQLPQRA